MECPYCGSDKYKTLHQGVPRCCLKRERATLPSYITDEQVLERCRRIYPVTKSRGKWYKRSPINKVLAAFSELVAKPSQYGEGFAMAWSEQQTIIPAVIKLLDYCDWDEEVAVEFVRIRFQQWYGHKLCPGFFPIVSPKMLSVHLTEAQRAVKTKREAYRLQDLAIAAMEGEENVFASAMEAM